MPSERVRPILERREIIHALPRKRITPVLDV